MLAKKPGVFMRIGNGVNADGSYHNVHTPNYDFNDEALALGSAYWANLVRQELGWAGETGLDRRAGCLFEPRLAQAAEDPGQGGRV